VRPAAINRPSLTIALCYMKRANCLMKGASYE
jgi:hypothetical protein